jgi:hypothetical protein
MRNYALQKGSCSFLKLRISPWEVLFPFLLCSSSLSIYPFPWRLFLCFFHRRPYLGASPCLPPSPPPGDSTGGSAWLGSTWRRGSARRGWWWKLAQATAGAGRLAWRGRAARAGAGGGRGSGPAKHRRWASKRWVVGGAARLVRSAGGRRRVDVLARAGDGARVRAGASSVARVARALGI